MDYGDILTRGFKTVWDKKYIWLLGFLALLSSGTIGGNALAGGGTPNFNVDIESQETPPWLQDIIDGGDPFQFFAEMLPVVIGVSIFLFLLGIVFWVIRVGARAGLIKAVHDETIGTGTSLGDAFRFGLGNFWKIFGLKFIIALPILLLLVVMAVLGGGVMAPIFASVGTSGGSPDEAVLASLGSAFLCIVPLFCVFLLLSIPITLIDTFAYRSIVLKGMGVWESIKDGWRIVRANLGEILVLGIIFTLISQIITYAVTFLTAPIGLIFGSSLMMQLLEGEKLGTGAIVSALLVGLVITIISMVVMSFITAVQSTVGTLAFMEFEGMEGLKDQETPLDFDM